MEPLVFYLSVLIQDKGSTITLPWPLQISLPETPDSFSSLNRGGKVKAHLVASLQTFKDSFV